MKIWKKVGILFLMLVSPCWKYRMRTYCVRHFTFQSRYSVFFSCQEFNVSTLVRLKGEVSIQNYGCFIIWVRCRSLWYLCEWNKWRSAKYKIQSWRMNHTICHLCIDICFLRFLWQTSDSHQRSLWCNELGKILLHKVTDCIHFLMGMVNQQIPQNVCFQCPRTIKKPLRKEYMVPRGKSRKLIWICAKRN